MRYKDVSKPLYEAVRYGNREKSYVLSNLNKFNFGVELEFDMPEPTETIKILDPRGAVRECIFSATHLAIISSNSTLIGSNYPNFSLEKINADMIELSSAFKQLRRDNTDNMYNISRFKDSNSDVFKYIITCVKDILNGRSSKVIGIWLSLLFPVTVIKDNKVVDVNDEIISVISQIHKRRVSIEHMMWEEDVIGDDDYDILKEYISSMDSFVGILSELPTDPKLEEIKNSKPLFERYRPVIDYLAGEIVGSSSSDENTFDIYQGLSPFIENSSTIDYYLYRMVDEKPMIVKLIIGDDISIYSANSDEDIKSLKTEFKIVPEGSNQIEFISPTCTGEEITQCFTDLKKLTDIVISQKGTTSNKTGLHLSISYMGDTSNFNALKFLLFSDSYRQIVKPEHVRDHVQSISDNLFKLAVRPIIEDLPSNNRSLPDTIMSIESALSKEKYMSVNIGVMDSSNGRVELRWPGGDGYEHRLNEYMGAAIRAMYALEIAYNPDAFIKEYLMSFFRVLDGLFKERLGCDILKLVGFLKRITKQVPGIKISWKSEHIVFTTSDDTVLLYRGNDFSDLKTIEEEILEEERNIW